MEVGTQRDPNGLGDVVQTVAWRYTVVRDRTYFTLDVDVTTGALIDQPEQVGFYHMAP